MRRFVICIDGVTPEQTEAFTAFCKEKKLNWWSWIGGFWLLTTRNETLSASDIVDKIIEITNHNNCFVMEIDKLKTWSGYGPQKEGKNMFTWIHKHWNTD